MEALHTHLAWTLSHSVCTSRLFCCWCHCYYYCCWLILRSSQIELLPFGSVENGLQIHLHSICKLSDRKVHTNQLDAIYITTIRSMCYVVPFFFITHNVCLHMQIVYAAMSMQKSIRCVDMCIRFVSVCALCDRLAWNVNGKSFVHSIFHTHATCCDKICMKCVHLCTHSCRCVTISILRLKSNIYVWYNFDSFLKWRQLLNYN